jgi:sugar phosphate isomerase/epimerase
MAQTCAEMDLDVELTVRANGHIKPENVPDELPAMVEALGRQNRKVICLALDTVRPDAPHWEKAIRTAKKLGIAQYRHRGFKYESGKPFKDQIATFHSMASEFAAANKQIGIQALYQIHAGREMAGGAAWDLDMILGDIDPKLFAVAFDVRHVLVEQGLSWPNAVQLLAPRIAALCVKSFRWDGKKPVDVPLGQGNVDQEIVQAVVAAHGGPLPVCIHMDYQPVQAVPFAERAKMVDAFRADARVLRGWLGLPNSERQES